MTCRSVSDMGVLFLTGDISGGDWAQLEFETTPWDDPAYFREISPLTYADRIRTPLLIQHSRAGHPDDDRPGRGAVHGPALAAPAGPAAARPRGDPRADPVRDAVPAGREPARSSRLVPPLPGRRASAGCRRSRRSAAGARRAARRRGSRRANRAHQPVPTTSAEHRQERRGVGPVSSAASRRRRGAPWSATAAAAAASTTTVAGHLRVDLAVVGERPGRRRT